MAAATAPIRIPHAELPPDILESPSAYSCWRVKSLPSIPEDVPQDLVCPITLELMLDPVTLVETGQTYERANLLQWWRNGSRSCPLTGTVVKSLRLRPNKSIQQQVHEWMAEHSIDAQAAARQAKLASKECFRDKSRTARCFVTAKSVSPPTAPRATSSSGCSRGNHCSQSLPSASDKSSSARKSWRRACSKAISSAFGPYWYSDNPYAHQGNLQRDANITSAAWWV
jgi:hypothetical protein